MQNTAPWLGGLLHAYMSHFLFSKLPLEGDTKTGPILQTSKLRLRDAVTEFLEGWPRWVLLPKSVWSLAAYRSKANKQARLVERLYFRCRPLDGGAEGGGHLSKADFPSPGNQWGMNFYRQKSGLGDYMQNLSHLQIGRRWSDRHHLGGFRYS